MFGQWQDLFVPLSLAVFSSSDIPNTYQLYIHMSLSLVPQNSKDYYMYQTKSQSQFIAYLRRTAISKLPKRTYNV